MRLIDAEYLEAYLEGGYDLNYGEILIDPREFVSIVDMQPTAFNQERVVAEIKEGSRVMCTKDIPHKYYKAIGTKLCEEIIIKGGV